MKEVDSIAFYCKYFLMKLFFALLPMAVIVKTMNSACSQRLVLAIKYELFTATFQAKVQVVGLSVR